MTLSGLLDSCDGKVNYQKNDREKFDWFNDFPQTAFADAAAVTPAARRARRVISFSRGKSTTIRDFFTVGCDPCH